MASVNQTVTWHKIEEGGKQPQHFVTYLVYVEDKDGGIFGYHLAYCYGGHGIGRTWKIQNDTDNRGMNDFYVKYFAEVPDLRSILYDGAWAPQDTENDR